MARSFVVPALVALALFASSAHGRDAGGKTGSTTAAEPPVVRELFSAEAEGLVEIRFIANDSRSAQVILKNTSGKPLSLKMPSAFAAVPVLAQMGMGGMGGMGGMNGMGGGGMGGGEEMGGGGVGGGGGKRGGASGGKPFNRKQKGLPGGHKGNSRTGFKSGGGGGGGKRPKHGGGRGS